MENSRSVSDPLPNLGLNSLDDRDALLIGLIADARRLAHSQFEMLSARVAGCKECRRLQEDDSWSSHFPPCKVGAVMAGLDALKKLTLARSPGPSAAPDSGTPAKISDTERCWIIRRCTQKWVGTELIYEYFPTPKGLMTRAEAELELKRVDETEPGEFSAHHMGRWCNSWRCADHISLAAGLEQCTPAPTAGPVDQPDGSCYEDPSPLRCRSCFNLRHSTPRHKPNCPCASQNCPGCVYAGESHLASCPVGVQLKQAGDDCCEGVDLPRFGLVHSFDCPVGDRPVIRASREYVAVEGGGR